MRILISALLCLSFVSCASVKRPEVVSSVEILEVKPRYIEEESFVRISEYWTGKENTGDRVILRSQVGERSGYYFTLVLDEAIRLLPQGTVIVGEFYTPNSTDVLSIDFKLPPKRPKTKEVFVGLTGDDWPDPDAVPSAWRFTIKDPNGKEMARLKSFLWDI